MARRHPEVLAGSFRVIQDDARLRRIAADDDAIRRSQLRSLDLHHQDAAHMVSPFQQTRERCWRDGRGKMLVGFPSRGFRFGQLSPAPT